MTFPSLSSINNNIDMRHTHHLEKYNSTIQSNLSLSVSNTATFLCHNYIKNLGNYLVMEAHILKSMETQKAGLSTGGEGICFLYEECKTIFT